MSYVAIPSNLKNVDSIKLELMSPEEVLNMSYGEVLTAETINYRTGTPQMNGLFCQAIFGPIKSWECACGKYKRYRYAGVICDKCGVEVTSSSVRRERMGHISLAAPAVHPWFLRVIPSRIATILDMKTLDVSKITYFSAHVITKVDESLQQEYLDKINREAESRVKSTKSNFDKRFEEVAKQFQIDKSQSGADVDFLKDKYETEKELLKIQEAETIAKIETITEVAKKELSSLKYKDVISEFQYQELAKKFGPVFKASIGADAINELLCQIDLVEEKSTLEEQLKNSKGEAKKKLLKRYKLINSFIKTEARPEWMVMKNVLVLPPELRPMLQLDGGRFAASDLNELYRRLINRNNRLRKLIQIGAPEVILRNEKRMLQEAVEALIDNSSRNGKQVMASTGVRRPLKSLTDILKGKQGRFRQNLLGKRVDYSGRSVIIIGPNLKLEEVGLPKSMAVELFTPFLIGAIIKKSEEGNIDEEKQAFNVHSARRLIEDKDPVIFDILDEIIQDKYVLLNRAPTLHRLSFLAFRPVLTEGKAIQLHPLVCRAFNADFDGDQMAVHLPITVKGQEEARDLMTATKNLLKPASGELIMGGHQDIVLGSYYLTVMTAESEHPKYFADESEAMVALDSGNITLGEKIITKHKDGQGGLVTGETTVGRLIFNNSFPKKHKYYNEEINKNAFESMLNEAFHVFSNEKMGQILDNIKNTAFKYVTKSGITLSTFDLISPKGKEDILVTARGTISEIQELSNYGLMTDNERYTQSVTVWAKAGDDIVELVKQDVDKLSNIGLMIKSGSRGNISQLNQMAGIKGLSVDSTGRVMELPAQHGYLEGLTGLEYFVSMKGGRKALSDIALKTADAGYLTRRLVDVAQNVIVMEEDCGTVRGAVITKVESARMNQTVLDRAYGRYTMEDVKDASGKVILSSGSLLDYNNAAKIKDIDLDSLMVRSATKCSLPRGVCQKCYGADFSTHKEVKIGTAVGVIAAQSLGEPSTQLTMRSKHTGGVLTKTDITAGLPRVEEIFEARTPKVIAPMSDFDGIIEKIDGDLDRGYTITLATQKAELTLPMFMGDKLLVDEGVNVKIGQSIMVDANGEARRATFSGLIEKTGDTLIIRQDNPQVKEYYVTPNIPLKVKVGDKVRAATPLSEGPLDLQELLEKTDVDTLQTYIIEQLEDVYTSNGLIVNEKHIEVVIRRMTNKVEILSSGNSEFTEGDIVSLSVVLAKNVELTKANKNIIVYKRTVTGISKASLATESFLSAASFQETSRVLVDAVITGRVDSLTGLKENVILGQLIPAGTGFQAEKSEAEIQEEIEEEIAVL